MAGFVTVAKSGVPPWLAALAVAVPTGDAPTGVAGDENGSDPVVGIAAK